MQRSEFPYTFASNRYTYSCFSCQYFCSLELLQGLLKYLSYFHFKITDAMGNPLRIEKHQSMVQMPRTREQVSIVVSWSVLPTLFCPIHIYFQDHFLQQLFSLLYH